MLANISEEERRLFTLAVGVVALSVISVIAFALTRGGVVFYVIALIALGLGLYMAYLLSRGSEKGIKRMAKGSKGQ